MLRRGTVSPDLVGSVVLVTGASRGIGRAAALRLSNADVRVVAFARDAVRLGSIVPLAPPGFLTVVAGDVTRPTDVERAFDHAERLGLLRGVLHCAGVLGSVGPFDEVPLAELAHVVEVNVLGTALVAQFAMQRLRRARGGSIVLLGGGGVAGRARVATYVATKAFVVRLAEGLAAEGSEQHIRVNALAPGFVATDIHKAVVDAGTTAGAELHAVRKALEASDTGLDRAVEGALFLLGDLSLGVSGRLVSAVHDDLERLSGHLARSWAADELKLRRVELGNMEGQG